MTGRRPGRAGRVGAVTAALLTLAPLTAAASCGTDASTAGARSEGRIRFGYIADYSGAVTVAVARQRGLWKKAGLTPELKRFTNGPVQVQALGSGSLDFGYLGPGALWMSTAGRAPVVAVNQLGLADRVIARPGSGIRKPADLKGRRVAVSEGTSGDMILDLALGKAGLKPTDVQKIRTDPSTAVTAFAAGKVDAAATWYPLVDTVRKKVPKLREISRTQDHQPRYAFPSVFVTRPDIPSQDPGLVRKAVSVIKEANDWAAAHPAASERITARFLHVPESQLSGATEHVRMMTSARLTRLTRDGTVERWFRGLGGVLSRMNRQPTRESPEDYYLGDLYTSTGKAAGK